ncbi:MAG: carbohydrate deacetylase [Erysipelotrichaceae bacterium]|nr:carbohydrate deacetylase [Erysipelotrichaceae bacterium]
MKLVINGDDLGYTKANTYGIFQAYTDGILRSATALVNAKYFEESIQKAQKEYPGLGIGVHLTLTLGKPLTNCPSLTDPEMGTFWKGRKALFAQELDYNEVYTEFKAQIDRFIETAGRRPTHLDSHHSVHDMSPEALAVSKRLAEEYGLQLRRYSSYRFIREFTGKDASVEKLIQLLEDNKDTDIEIMCHPGWCDLELFRESSYSLGRVQELAVLCDEEVIRYIHDRNIELCHYE